MDHFGKKKKKEGGSLGVAKRERERGSCQLNSGRLRWTISSAEVKTSGGVAPLVNCLFTSIQKATFCII